MKSRSFPTLLHLFSFLLFLGFAGLVVFLAIHTDHAARSFSACAVPPDTIPGIPEPRFFLENDSYVWLSHARDLLNSGGWRLRHTCMDNTPYGRPMHWSHLLIWSILLPAKAIMAIAHWPAARAVELAGVWAMPFWHIVFLALLFLALPRRIGLVPTTILALLCVSNECIAIVAFPLKPDHHIFQMAFGTAFFLCLQYTACAGLPPPSSSPMAPHRIPLCRFPLPPSPAEALRAATAAGVFLGLLYWIGATVAFFVLALFSIAVLPLLPCFRPHIPSPSPFPPALWRRFAVSAVTVAAACWLLEYAPSHFSMHLEVNHPLHWLPIAGVALGLSTLSSLPRRPRPSDIFSPRLLLVVALVAAIPLIILFGPVSWHQLKDPVLRRLHDAYLVEFQPFRPTLSALFATRRLPALALFLTPVVLLCAKRLSIPVRARPVLLSSFLFVFLFLAAACWQQRWGFLFSAGLYALAILLFLALHAPPPPPGTRSIRRPLLALAATLLVADAAYAIHARLVLESRIASAAAIPDVWIRNDMHKRLSLRLAGQMGTNRWSVAGCPNIAPVLYYYAGIPSLASHYWENLDGWHAETAIMADTSSGFTNALAITASRGLSHLIVTESPSAPLLFQQVGTGSTNLVSAIRDTFCGHLANPRFRSGLPPEIFDDTDLNAIANKPVVFRTPSGFAQETSTLHLFALGGTE